MLTDEDKKRTREAAHKLVSNLAGDVLDSKLEQAVELIYAEDYDLKTAMLDMLAALTESVDDLRKFTSAMDADDGKPLNMVEVCQEEENSLASLAVISLCIMSRVGVFRVSNADKQGDTPEAF